MKTKKQVKPKLQTVVLTPVQKLEKYLLENNLSIGVQAVHKQMWRRRFLEIASRALKVQVVPFVYTTKK